VRKQRGNGGIGIIIFLVAVVALAAAGDGCTDRKEINKLKEEVKQLKQSQEKK
jgi:hypothetical protein